MTAAYQNDNYQTFINTKRQQFIETYLQNAVENAVETLSMKYADKEYQYTLYYYDQAGNLVQTVPPEGVDRFSEDALEAGLNNRINAHRDNNIAQENSSLLPKHEFLTEYRYNSLNQLVWQKTPDGVLLILPMIIWEELSLHKTQSRKNKIPLATLPMIP